MPSLGFKLLDVVLSLEEAAVQVRYPITILFV
jgi:hypothetical protein